MKIYTLSNLDVADEQKTITVEETGEIITTTKTSIAQLKERHIQKLKQIETCKIEADKIVDEIIAIDADTGIDIIVKDIPIKLMR